MAVVAFISQKGGTGKSTLARALAAIVAHAGLAVRIADLDPQQSTVIEWEKLRHDTKLAPIPVEAFNDPGCAKTWSLLRFSSRFAGAIDETLH